MIRNIPYSRMKMLSNFTGEEINCAGGPGNGKSNGTVHEGDSVLSELKIDIPNKTLFTEK